MAARADGHGFSDREKGTLSCVFGTTVQKFDTNSFFSLVKTGSTTPSSRKKQRFSLNERFFMAARATRKEDATKKLSSHIFLIAKDHRPVTSG